ncbi:MAG: glycosyltransferase family 9 protein [Deltaproteobacteria bacterium]|nr:glycosyltransferase family 9 protein [Deltaproteobacteria bacterium]MCB9488976.1 glycosyltransferase family 9 protein [Deltaproteobacteria bacterium]
MAGRSPLDLSRLRRVLIHKPDHLGDVLTAVPTLHALRRAAPEAHFAAAMLEGPDAVWRELGLVHEVRHLPQVYWWKTGAALSYVRWARSRRFELVVNLRHDFRDIGAMRFLGAKYVATPTHRIFGQPASHAFLPPRDDKPEWDNHANALRELGLPVEPYALSENLKASFASARQGLDLPDAYIAMHPFARQSAKRWPLDRCLSLIDRLATRERPVVLLGGPEHVGEIGTFAKNKNVIDRVGMTDIAGLMAAVAGARLLITFDSGPGHIAPLVGCPVLAIMSGTNEHQRWAPAGARVIAESVPCAPCHKPVCSVDGHPCMTGIDVDRVADAALEMMTS